MKTPDSFSVRFILRKSKTVNGMAPVNAHICLGSERAELFMKKTLTVSQWDFKKSKPKSTTADLIAFGQFLESMRTKLTQCY